MARTSVAMALVACGAPTEDDTALADPTLPDTTGGQDEGPDDAPDDGPDDAPDDGPDDGPDDATEDGPEGTEDGTDSTGAGQTDDTTGSPDCAPRPAPDPAWILDYEDELVATLSGEQPTPGGVTLGVRQSQSERDATGDYLLDELAALGLDTAAHVYSDSGRNVFATLPATDGGEDVYVIGAHFDTVPGSPGANDNATGVAMVLSVARYLSEVECRSANVIFVLFDQEEIGLVGSFAFAQWLAEQELPVVAVHTIDQMGWDSDGDRTIELERADDGLFELYEAAEADLAITIPLIPTNTGFTDHVSFRELGFSAVGLTEEFVSGDTTRHYHQSTDVYDTVDLEYLRSTTILAHEVFGRLIDPS